ncbi:hypothetical protein [Bermanella sp. R86510]|uniref:hypothetical protein n=1 Tax=unclassified Bermanella TaxID=2627862 RepID=UPI0037CA7F25
MSYKVLIALLIIGVGAGIALYQPNKNHNSDLDVWVSKTQSLFSETGQFFSRLSLGPETTPVEKREDPLEDEVDVRLQELLPPDRLVLEVDQDTPLSSSDEQKTAFYQDPSSEPLPNLFIPRKKDQKTAIKGQIFTDENDEIIGAEVQLAIPTN